MSDWINVADITPRIAYTATSLQTAFTVPFVFFANADLLVYQNGVLLTLDTDYTVTGAEDEDGGTITLLTGAALSDEVMIVREVPIEQTTHIPPSGPIDVPAINIQISKLVAMIQQLFNGLTRSLRLPDNISGELEIAEPVAGEFLKWNATANGVESAAVVTPNGSYAIATQSEAEAGALNNVLMTPLRSKQHFDVAYAAAHAAEQVFNVSNYGAVGDGTTDDSAAFAAAIAAVGARGGGILRVPAGYFRVDSGVTLSNNVILQGVGRVATWLYRPSDGTVLTLDSSGQNSAEHLAVMGKGNAALDAIFGETSFGSSVTADAVVMSASGGFLRDIQIQGGRRALSITCTDSLIINVDCSKSYGASNVVTTGANWHYHCKWDNGGDVGPADTTPYSNWAAATAYTVGKIRKNSGFLMICSVAGTSGATAPALRNYGFTITDGTCRWKLLSPDNYVGLYISGGGENHFHQVDLSGSGSYTSASLIFDGTPAFDCVCIFDSGVFSDVVDAVDGAWLNITNCEFGSSVILAAGYSGRATIVGNWGVTASAFNVVVGANVNGFIVANNQMHGGAVTVAAGTSNRYQIAHNNEVTVTDGGTGINKSVTGNS